MEAKSNYTIIGLLVLLLTAGLLSGGLWLSVGFDRKSYDTYAVYMDEPVSGLNMESPVKYNGVKIGYISDIQLNPNDPQRVTLLIAIEQGTPITTSTRATLVAQGITGNTFLGLTAISSSLTPLQRTPQEPYPVIAYQPSFYYLLEKNINTLSESLKRIFSEENTQHIGEALRDLPGAIQSIKESTVHFNTMATDVSKAGNQFTTTMRSGKNSIDQLSQQTIPAAVLLLRRLDSIAANLEIVSNQLRQNPAVIIRGTTPPRLGPGESR